jgi:hypothetical protein
VGNRTECALLMMLRKWEVSSTLPHAICTALPCDKRLDLSVGNVYGLCTHDVLSRCR